MADEQTKPEVLITTNGSAEGTNITVGGKNISNLVSADFYFSSPRPSRDTAYDLPTPYVSASWSTEEIGKDGINKRVISRITQDGLEHFAMNVVDLDADLQPHERNHWMITGKLPERLTTIDLAENQLPVNDESFMLGVSDTETEAVEVLGPNVVRLSK